MYKTGSIAVTNNSAIVTGSGTLWVDAGVLNAGDLIFCPDGTLQEVLSFQSNTQLTLAGDGHGNTVYLGATLAGQAYGIVPIGMLPSSLALQVKTTLNAAQAAIGSAVLSTAAQGLTATQQGNARANILALGASDVGKGLLVKSVAGGVEVVLTASEASNQFIELTGALTASINLVVPAAARLFVIKNSTTGAYTVTVKTAAGTGVTALQGSSAFLACDGTNVVNPLSSVSGPLAVTGALSASGWETTGNGTAVTVATASAYNRLTNAGGSFYIATDNSAGTGFASGAGAYAVNYYATAAVPHVWSISNLEKMRLDASGNLLVGMAALVAGSGATGGGVAITKASGLLITSVTDPIFRGYNTSLPNPVFNLANNGDATNTNNSYGAISDLKLKENIVDCTPKLGGINQIRIVNYNLKSDPLHKQIGVIAQELELIYPGLIDETPDYIEVTKTREIEVPEVPAVDAVLDADGVEVTPAVAAIAATTRTEEYTEQEATGEVTKSVKYSVFVPMLIKAMQEQQVMIDSLAARLAAANIA